MADRFTEYQIATEAMQPASTMATARTRRLTVRDEGLRISLPLMTLRKNITREGMQAAARIESSGILNMLILDIAMTDQWRISRNAKKFIFLLKVISIPSIYRATALGITGVVICGNSSPLNRETRGYASVSKSITIPQILYFPDFWKDEKCVARSYIHEAAIMHQNMVITLE